MLDVTIVYPDGTPSFWDLISGQIPRVRVDVREVPLDPRVARTGLRADDERSARSSRPSSAQVWAEKDARIDEMLADARERGSEAGPLRGNSPENRN